MYYDKSGAPITRAAYAALLGEDAGDYRRVALTQAGAYRVSTVWLGSDHNFLDKGPPLIFETMVFRGPEGLLEVDCDRYATLEEAEEGHAKFVAKWKDVPENGWQGQRGGL